LLLPQFPLQLVEAEEVAVAVVAAAVAVLVRKILP
jgi:hypothetical protein